MGATRDGTGESRVYFTAGYGRAEPDGGAEGARLLPWCIAALCFFGGIELSDVMHGCRFRWCFCIGTLRFCDRIGWLLVAPSCSRRGFFVTGPVYARICFECGRPALALLLSQRPIGEKLNRTLESLAIALLWHVGAICLSFMHMLQAIRTRTRQ